MTTVDIPAWLLRVAAFAMGAVWGSFFNVAIYRWPRGMSVVTPPSHCPACGAQVSAFRNVPIVGYVLLRGKAGCCGAKLTPRYLVVELVSAMLALALAERYVLGAGPDAPLLDTTLEASAYFVFAGGLVIASFVDLEWMEIPDEVSLGGAALGLVTSTFRQNPGPEAAALGAGGGFLVIQLFFVWTYERVMGRRGMGEGDAKLLMMIGAFLGWKGAAFAVIAGSLQGVLAAVVLLTTGKQLTPVRPDAVHDADETKGKLKMPFGPFLSLAALEFLFFGEFLLESYFAFIGES